MKLVTFKIKATVKRKTIGAIPRMAFMDQVAITIGGELPTI